MLMPKRTKYRRPHRLSYEGRAKAGREVSFGEYGLMADTGAYVSNRQIEAARIAMTRYMKRGGKVWIRIFPHMARTKKPLEVRMGSGKGAPEGWVAVVKPGRMMFENLRTLPPKQRITNTSLAPVLSATRNLLSFWIMNVYLLAPTAVQLFRRFQPNGNVL